MGTDNKELSSIEKELNRASKGNANFSNIREVGNGQYELLVQLNPNTRAHDLFSANPSEIKGLIKERKVDPNSLLARVTGSSSDAFLKEVEQAGVRDITNIIKNSKNAEEIKKTIEDVDQFNKTVASSLNQRYRDVLSPNYLDLREKSPDTTKALDLYDRSKKEYLKSGIYGTVIDLLSNFAATGFYNEVADPAIKEFFDSWVQDTNFISVVGKIFHNLFKFSVAYVLPATGTYEPNKDGISSIPGKEPKKGTTKAQLAFLIDKVLQPHGLKLDYAKFDKKYAATFKENAQKGTMPINYMLLDPNYVAVDSSGVFGGETLTIMKKGLQGIKKAAERKSKGKLSKEEEALLRLLPSKIVAAATADKEYVDVDGYISSIYLRKDDFDIFAKPRGARVFDALDFKDELRKVDYATLDGVFNYILKVTVGDKDNPVTDLSTLNSLAEAFNTPQKAFTVVWNHTLQIEKITSPEIGQILGAAKYEPVEKDITAALGMSRALIDGDNVSAAAGILSSKAIQSEINLARQRVESWIYDQYKLIATGTDFKTYPVVRWAQFVISTDGDAVTRASWMQAVDRQLVSRQTAQKAIGLDPASELEKLREELALRQEGIGIQGSPFQQSPSTTVVSGPTEVTSPSGDQGRPAGQPAVPKNSVDQVKVVKRKTKVTSPSQQKTQVTKKTITAAELVNLINELEDEEKTNLLLELSQNSEKDIFNITDMESLEELTIEDELIQENSAIKQPKKGEKVAWVTKELRYQGVIKDIYIGIVEAVINGKRVTRVGTPKFPVILIEANDGSQFLMSIMARTLEKVTK
jgi:hypothetical protein